VASLRNVRLDQRDSFSLDSKSYTLKHVSPKIGGTRWNKNLTWLRSVIKIKGKIPRNQEFSIVRRYIMRYKCTRWLEAHLYNEGHYPICKYTQYVHTVTSGTAHFWNVTICKIVYTDIPWSFLIFKIRQRYYA